MSPVPFQIIREQLMALLESDAALLVIIIATLALFGAGFLLYMAAHFLLRRHLQELRQCAAPLMENRSELLSPFAGVVRGGGITEKAAKPANERSLP
ncbi:Uncharacterised protein [Achromobacter sp. 2789STDY5608633]|jgi:hypothetical protein|uniref:hypothetical protein n=1 Tax=Achromobacter sp. 2789STDY5608633 TaxID=1806501 RepID=UPI0006C0BC77|nr:hypothetical protein [Achromobacter sp. 2789STDY5608633]CUJ50924.1 Uncharacterised protein [Achromobacter sp. 2789STDY5608633]